MVQFGIVKQTWCQMYREKSQLSDIGRYDDDTELDAFTRTSIN